MIDKKTLLILGAGASAPYGFPTGMELRSKIIKDIRSIISPHIKNKEEKSGYFDFAVLFADKFKHSSVNSIDRFLNEQKPEIIKYGKFIIMALIKECEMKMKLNENISDHKLDWYRLFYNKFIAGAKYFAELSFKNIEIITFNYDRSFEYYIYKSLRNTYPQISDNNIINLMKTLQMHHIFGKIAPFPWDNGHFIESLIDNEFLSPFGDIDLIYKQLDEIKIIHEVEKINIDFKSKIENSKNVFFLGFGYADENLKILGAPYNIDKLNNPNFYCTAFGFSELNIKQIQYKLVKPLNDVTKPIMLNCNCYSLLNDYLI